MFSLSKSLNMYLKITNWMIYKLINRYANYILFLTNIVNYIFLDLEKIENITPIQYTIL